MVEKKKINDMKTLQIYNKKSQSLQHKDKRFVFSFFGVQYVKIIKY